MPYWTYALINPDGEIYIGQTSHLDARLAEHNDPENRLTLHTKRHRGPWRLLHSEEWPTRADPMRRERQLKSANVFASKMLNTIGNLRAGEPLAKRAESRKKFWQRWQETELTRLTDDQRQKRIAEIMARGR